MKITDIELHEIHPPLRPLNDDVLKMFSGDNWDARTIVVLHTDNGLEGLGEVEGAPTERLREEVEQLRGTNSCRWLGHPQLNIRVAPAIYDLVGKANQGAGLSVVWSPLALLGAREYLDGFADAGENGRRGGRCGGAGTPLD